MYDAAAIGYEYRYSPTFAVLFSPFACLPARLGGMLWGVMNVSLFFGALQILRKYVLPSDWTTRQHAGFLLLTFLGSASALWNGQTNTLIVSCIAGAAACVIRRNWWLAAGLLAVPIYIKVWPAAAALLFLACWPRELFRKLVVVCGVLALIPFLTKPPGVVGEQYYYWIEALTGPMHIRHVYRDAWTLWETLHPPVNPTVFSYLQLGSAGCVLALCLWQRWRSGIAQQTCIFIMGMWAAWQLLFGPGSERTTACIIAPILSWGVIVSIEHGRSRWPLAAFGLVTLCTFGDFERLVSQLIPAIPVAIPVGVLLFAAWLVNYVRHNEAEGFVIAPNPHRGFMRAIIQERFGQRFSSH